MFRAGKRYKKWLKRIFGKEIPRCQFNFPCDRSLIAIVKLMAKQFECPIYCVAEHCLQLGLGELAMITSDSTLKEEARKHLIEGHLLLPAPESESVMTRQAARIRNALQLVSLFEMAKTPEEFSNILKKLAAESTEEE